MYTIKCSEKFLEELDVMLRVPLTYIHLINVKVLLHNVHINTNNLLIFKWKLSQLEDICNINGLSVKQLQLLDYSQNNILELTDNCFISYDNIQVLLLHQNKIKYISRTTFSFLHKLIKLDLSCNNLRTLSEEAYIYLDVYLLNISYNAFTKIGHRSTVGDNIHATLVSTDDYRICCLLKLKRTVCLQGPKWPQTCNSMLEVSSLKILCLSHGLLILTLNLMGLANIFFSSSGTRKSPFQTFTNALGANDLIFGVYTIVIFVKNSQHSSYYVTHDQEWRASYFCFILAILQLYATLYSIFVSLMITTFRFVAVTFPLSSSFKGLRVVKKYLVIGFIFCVLICLAVTLFYLVIEKKICHAFL